MHRSAQHCTRITVSDLCILMRTLRRCRLELLGAACTRYIKSFEFNKVNLDECRSVQISSNDWLSSFINAAVCPSPVCLKMKATVPPPHYGQRPLDYTRLYRSSLFTALAKSQEEHFVQRFALFCFEVCQALPGSPKLLQLRDCCVTVVTISGCDIWNEKQRPDRID